MRTQSASTLHTTPMFNRQQRGAGAAASSLPSKTLKRRRPRHPGFLQPGSVARVHGVSPVHVARVQVPLGVRKAPLSHSVVLAHCQRVVERGERSLVLLLLPPQMFGRLRAHAAAAASDQGHRPHFAAGGVHPPRRVFFFSFYLFMRRPQWQIKLYACIRNQWLRGRKGGRRRGVKKI